MKKGRPTKIIEMIGVRNVERTAYNQLLDFAQRKRLTMAKALGQAVHALMKEQRQ